MPTPGAASDLGISGVGYNSANLAWTIVDDSYVDGIEIERSPAGAGSWVQVLDAAGILRAWSDPGLNDGKAYDWRVRTRGPLGEYSAYCSTASATTDVKPPTGLHFTGHPTSIDISWTNNSGNGPVYDIYMGAGAGTLIYTTAANATSYSKTTLTPATWYNFRVIARTADKESSYIGGSCFTADPPNAPSVLVLLATGTTKILATVQDNSDNEDNFVWEIDTSAGFETPDSYTTAANTPTYEFTGLSSNTVYYVRVSASNSSGSSATCSAVSVSTLDAIAQPTNLRLTSFKVGGVLGIEAIFDDNSELDTNHLLERRGYLASVEKMTDKGLETWTNSTTLTNWTKTLGGTSALAQTSDVPNGYFAQFTVDASNNNAYLAQSTTLVAGAPYKLSIWYKTASAKTAFAQLIGGGQYLKSDGTWSGSSQYIALPSTSGVWNLYTLYFNAHASYTAYTLYCGHYSAYSAETSSVFYISDISIVTENPFAALATLEPNQTYYFDGPLTTGNVYEYRVRAFQSPSAYSAYSTSAVCTVLAVPAAPTSPTVSEYQDTWARFTWTASAGAAYYEVYKAIHGGAFTLYRTVLAGCEYCKINGLAPSTTYGFKVRAINAAGSSGYTTVPDSGSVTTRAAYLRSKFEKLQMEQSPVLINLIEVNPTIDVTGWTLVGGKTYTYSHVFSEIRAILIESVTENGDSLSIQTSIANVEGITGSFYFDFAAQTLYVHSSGSNDPVNYLYLGSFWLLFTTGDPRDSGQQQPVEFNGRLYLPFVPADGIPAITQTLEPYYKGSFTQSHGGLSLINAMSPAWGNVGFFDKLHRRYNWKGRKIRTLTGSVGFTYSEFYTPATGIITNAKIVDQRIDFTLRDYRENLKCQLPKDDYWVTVFPNLSPNVQKGNPRPFHWGTIVGFSPACIDTVNRVFEVHNGRISSVEDVYLNDVALTAGTDYFVDYQRGRITLARTLHPVDYVATDKITVDFTGQVDDLGNAIVTGPAIFADILIRFMGVPFSDINWDSIGETAETETAALALSIYKKRSSEELIGLIEKSCMAYSFQDNLGRLGLKPVQAAASSGAIYIPECRVSNFGIADPGTNTYSGVDLGYAEDFAGQFTVLQTTINANLWRDGSNVHLPISTALSTGAQANALTSRIVAALNMPVISFDVDRVLYTAQAGDIIYFSRGRYFDADGSAANKELRIMTITKSQSGGVTNVTAEEA